MTFAVRKFWGIKDDDIIFPASFIIRTQNIENVCHGVHVLAPIKAIAQYIVFGDLQGVGTGLVTLEQLLGSGGYAQLQHPARYLSGMLFLERKLSARSDLLDVIASAKGHRP